MTNLSNHVILLWLIVLALPSVTQAQTGKVSNLQTTVKDLVLRVDDMGGKVQTLAVKESPVEVRIDLAADVLFDFDKAEILPKAQQTLAQRAIEDAREDRDHVESHPQKANNRRRPS